MPTESEILKAIEEGASTTEDLVNRFGITKLYAAVLLSRYFEKGVIVKHSSQSDGKRGRPHIVYRVSPNGYKKLEREKLLKELAELKAKIEEIHIKLNSL